MCSKLLCFKKIYFFESFPGLVFGVILALGLIKKVLKNNFLCWILKRITDNNFLCWILKRIADNNFLCWISKRIANNNFKNK